MCGRVIRAWWERGRVGGWSCGMAGECVGGQVGRVGGSIVVWESRRAGVWVGRHVGGLVGCMGG